MYPFSSSCAAPRERAVRACAASFMITALGSALALSSCGAAHGPEPRFSVSSPDIVQGVFASAQAFNGFGCSGANVSPTLAWQHAPNGTKSFAITMHDLDAPVDGGFWHWAMYNIPATAQGVAADAGRAGGAAIGATLGRSDFGDVSYGGPCPPAGDRGHRYTVTVYALPLERLDLADGAIRVRCRRTSPASAASTTTGAAVSSRWGARSIRPAPSRMRRRWCRAATTRA
jgi:Raf kinase inhibitor-like YbhB/YbcL family protein